MKYFISSFVLLLSVVLVLFINSAQAQSSDSFSLGLYPTLLEIKATTPAKIEGKITIQNQGDDKQSLEIKLKSFKSAMSKDGKIEFLDQDQTSEQDAVILGNVKILEDNNEINTIELAPLESKDIIVFLDIDNDSPPGDYYFSVLFLSTTQPIIQGAENSYSRLSGGLGTNIILSVDNNAKIEGQIVEFSAPIVNLSRPIPLTLLLRNESKQFIVPSGQIIIKDMFGRESGNLPIPPQHILSGSERYLRSQSQASLNLESKNSLGTDYNDHPVLAWDEKFLFGLYSATAHVKLSDNGPIFVAETKFLAIPIHAILAISLFAFVIIGIWIQVKRKIKN